MRSSTIGALVLVLGIGLATPVVAQQKPHRRECIKLTQQIARYERDAGWAKDRGNALWEASNVRQAGQLSTRRARLCPEFRETDYAAEVLAFLDVAASVAARWYLPGL